MAQTSLWDTVVVSWEWVWEVGMIRGLVGVGGKGGIHGFAVAGLFEDFRCHVAWCAAGRGQDVELLLVHDSRQAEVGYQEVCVVFWSAEEEVFGFEVAVDDAVVVEVGYSREGGPNEVGSVGFVVAAFSTDSIE